MLTRAAFLSALSVAAACLAAAGDLRAAAQTDDRATRLKGWLADVDLFASELPRRHANAFHHISRQAFDARVASLRQRLARIDSDELWVGLDQIENAIGDGHTFMRMPADAPRFGLDLKQFGSDYRVVAIAPGVPGKGVLGSRLVAIDGMAVARARALILSLTPQDELQSLRDFRSQALLANGLALHGLGITASRDTATYQFEDDAGHRTRLLLHGGSLAPRTLWQGLPGRASDRASDRPMQCSAVRSTTVCRFRSYDGLEQTSQQLFETVRRSHSRRLVIDMRENNGGNFCKGLEYLVRPIAADPVLNRPGGLYVLIGQQTFSAAMSNAAQFRQLTYATLVGQAIGEKPNSYQEIEDLHLPFTRWDARYSSRFYRFVEGGDNIIRPDVPIALDWTDYKHGGDAALAYVMRQPIGKPGGDHPKSMSAKAAGIEYCDS